MCHFTKTIELSRGCRQGDPISPYIFVLCAEILLHVIREKSDIRGIKVFDNEVKLSTYADDTTLYLNADKESLSGAMRVLDWFKKISGLGINKEKTKVIKIGPVRDRSINWEGKFRLKWTEEFEVLGISYNSRKMGEITENNISKKIKDMKNIISVWKIRNLTPYGKVVLIKSLLFSKITHILLSLPSPNPDTFAYLQEMINDFLWGGKPPKFRKQIMEADIKDGGLRLHNLSLFDLSLKIGWLKRYLRTTAKWKSIPDNFELEGVLTFGKDYLERISEMNFNPFWANVLDGLKKLMSKDSFSSRINILETPLWFNDALQLRIKRSWLEKGICTIWDLMKDTKNILSQEEFVNKYDIATNFLDYGAVASKIRGFLRNKELPLYDLVSPCNSSLNIIISLDRKGVSNIYRMMIGRNEQIIETAVKKWSEKIELDICSFSMRKSFIINSKIDDIYLRYIQFRTLHRRFFTNNLLLKMGIKESSICNLCNREEDSNEHMLINCQVSSNLWNSVEIWINEIMVSQYVLTDKIKILGELDKAYWILITKKVIFLSKLKNSLPSLFRVKMSIRNMYDYELLKYTLLDKVLISDKRWGMLTEYYESIQTV